MERYFLKKRKLKTSKAVKRFYLAFYKNWGKSIIEMACARFNLISVRHMLSDSAHVRE